MSLVHAMWECHTYVWILISKSLETKAIFSYILDMFSILFDLLISFNKQFSYGHHSAGDHNPLPLLP